MEAAIAYFQAALEEFTRSRFPIDWAATQKNLGCAYRNRLNGEKAENLDAAIKCYQGAMEVYNRDRFPMEWEVTQKHLDATYSEHMRG